MKKILVLLPFLALLFSCGTRNADLDACRETLLQELDTIFTDTTLTENEKTLKAKEICMSLYQEHRKDSLGLELLVPISFYASPQEVIDLYEDAEAFIKENANVKRRVRTLKNAESVAPGNPFKEITGIHAVIGDTLALSSLLSKDKPNVIDFWASWCSPCRNEIKTHLLDLAAGGKFNIVGIAVWEKSIDDTRNAMDELGITWPVIFCGDRENSPSIDYGVVGIPELFLISTDGIIMASGNTIEDLGL